MALINFNQIKGGVHLATTVDNLNSFMATHTTAAKDEFPITQQTTQFTLTATPADEPVTLDINGIVYKEGVDFTMDRQTRTVTWTSTDFDITPDITDVVVVNYSTAYTATTGGGSNTYTPRAAEHVVGMVLTKEGGGAGTWVRVDQNFNTVQLDANHGTWAGMHTVNDPVYGEFVEIPITYVRSEVLTDGPYIGKQCWWTADGYAEGFHVHPAFIGADGQPHNIQIASWFASDKNGVTYSADCGSTYDGYIGNVSYDDLEQMGWSINGSMRAYNVYDYYFLARLMLTEFNGPFGNGNTTYRRLITNGITWDGSQRVVYHGIHDPYGINSVPSPGSFNGIRPRLYGFSTANGVYNVMKNDGSLQMVTTQIPCPTDAMDTVMVNCLMVNGNEYDFGDLFITNEVTRLPQNGSFLSSQELKTNRWFSVVGCSTDIRWGVCGLSTYSEASSSASTGCGLRVVRTV